MSTNISLTPELEAYAKNQVSSGLYSSISEFMREAIRIHREKNLEHRLYLSEMNRELNQAAAEIDSNNISPFNMQKITEEALNELD
jgi:putative addiction module CopG family antidote